MSKNSRYAKIERTTSETFVKAELGLDGTGLGNISTTIPFVDHMLNLLAKHGLFDLTVEAKGATEIALNLERLYLYVYTRLIRGNNQLDQKAIEEAIHLMGNLCRAWEQIIPGSPATSKPVSANA